MNQRVTGRLFRCAISSILLLLFPYIAFSQSSTAATTDVLPPFPPGAYPRGIVIDQPSGETWSYRFVDSAGTPHTDFFIPIDGGIVLDAPSGGHAIYRIEFRDRSSGEPLPPQRYVIDREPPAVPEVSVPPGVYSEAVSTALYGDAEDVTAVRYRVDRRGSSDDRFDDSFQEIVDGEPLRLAGSAGNLVEYTVLAYAVDSVGNRSELTSWRYRIDRRNEVPRRSPLITSPAPGVYANEQLLLVNTRGVADVTVQLETPRGTESFSYDGELPIDGSGSYFVTVEAVSPLTGETVSETVRWTQDDTTSAVAQSGRYTEAFRVFPQFDNGTVRYNLTDTPVSSSDDRLVRPISFSAGLDEYRTVVLRYRLDETVDETAPEWRFTYVIDGRRAPPPDIVEYDNSLVVFSLAENEIQYREVDSDGNGAFQRYDAAIPFASLSDSTVAVEARARFPGSTWSAIKRIAVPPELVTQPETNERPPSVRVSGAAVDISGIHNRRIRVTDPNGRTVLRGKDVETLRWTVPAGYRADLDVVVESANEPIRFTADTAPPTPAEIIVDGRTVTFRPDDNVMYRIDGTPFRRYSEPFEVTAISDARVDRTIEAYRTVDGEQSPRTLRTVTIDSRPIELPPLLNEVSTETGLIVTRNQRFALEFANPHDDFRIYYEVSTERLPPLPTESSASTDGSIRIDGEPDEERTVNVRVRGRFSGRDGWTPVETYRVVIDLQPPEPPVIESPDGEPLSGSDRISVRFADPDEDDVSIWYRIAPATTYLPYSGPFSVDRQDRDSTGVVTVEAYTRDSAGNRTFLSEPLRITFADTAIVPPRFTVNGRVVGGPQIALNRESIVAPAAVYDPSNVWWRVFAVESAERPPFVRSDEPFVVTTGDRPARYIAETYVELEKQRSATRRLSILVDPEGVAPVPQPRILRDTGGNSGTLFWPGTRDREIFVSIDGVTEGFQPSDDVTAWTIPTGRDRITVAFFAVDEFGRRSETQTILIDRTRSVPPPRFIGVSDGGVYAENRNVEIVAEGTVRYSVTTDGTEPSPVHALSPRYTEAIPLRVAAGEDRQYRIRATVFDDATGTALAEREISVRIDRRRPEAPRLENVASGTYFSETTRVSFTPHDEARIMYRVISDPSDAESLSYTEYTGEPIVLAAQRGAVRTYTIDAYTVDSAGNRSQSVPSWELFVDQEIVYVAGDEDARTGADGTRQDPVPTLEEALDIVRRSGRRTVFIASGTYQLDGADLAAASRRIPDLSIVGSFDQASWTPGETTLLEGSGPIDAALSDGTTLRAVAFEGPSQITVTGDAVRLESITGASLGVTVRGDTAEILDARIPILAVDGGTLRIEGSTVGTLRVTAGAVDATNTTLGGIHAEARGTVAVRSSVIDASEAMPSMRESTEIIGRGGTIRIEDTVVRGVSAAVQPVVRLDRSTLAVERSVLHADAVNGGTAFLVQSRRSSISVYESYLSSAGGEYAYGITGTDSSIAMERSVLAVTGSSEQVAIASVTSRLVVEDSAVINRVATVQDAAGVVRALQLSGRGEAVPMFRGSIFIRLDAEERDEPVTFGTTSALERRERSATLERSAGAVRVATDLNPGYEAIGIVGWERFISRNTPSGFPTTVRDQPPTEPAVTIYDAATLHATLRRPAFGELTVELLAEIIQALQETLE